MTRSPATSESDDSPILSMVGKGIYTPQEVSLYAGVPLSTVRSWLFGTSTRHRLFDRELPDVDQYVTFWDLIQTVGARAYRKEHCLPMHKLRFAIELARDTYGIQFPLASNKSRIVRVGNNLAIELDDGTFVDATRKHQGCYLFQTIIKQLGVKIEYNKRSGMAEQFRAKVPGRVPVVLNPHVLFGSPYLPSCGYTAETLAHAVVTEGSHRAAAEAYGVKVAEIKAAQAFISSLQKSAA